VYGPQAARGRIAKSHPNPLNPARGPPGVAVKLAAAEPVAVAVAVIEAASNMQI